MLTLCINDVGDQRWFDADRVTDGYRPVGEQAERVEPPKAAAQKMNKAKMAKTK